MANLDFEGRLKRSEREMMELRKKNDTFSDLNINCWKGNTFITEAMPTPDGPDSLVIPRICGEY